MKVLSTTTTTTTTTTTYTGLSRPHHVIVQPGGPPEGTALAALAGPSIGLPPAAAVSVMNYYLCNGC